MIGTIDPATYVPEELEKPSNAGAVMAELQKRLDAWAAETGKK